MLLALAVVILSYFESRLIVTWSGKQIFFLVITVLTTLVCLFSLRAVLYLLIIVVIAYPSFGQSYRIGGIEVAGLNIKIVEILYGVTMFSWVLQVVSRRIRLPGLKENLPIFALFLLILISAVVDILHYGRLQNTIMGLKSLSYYGLYFVVVSGLTDIKDIRRIHNVIIVGALLYCALVITMYLWRSNPIFLIFSSVAVEGNVETGRFGFRNDMIMPVIISLVMLRYVFSKNSRERFKWALSALPMILVLILSGNRTGWVFMVLSVIGPLALLLRKHEITPILFFRGVAVSCGIVLVMIGVLHVARGPEMFSKLSNRMKTFQSVSTDSSIVYRIKMVKKVTPGIMEHLVVGVGFSKYYYDPVSDEHFPGSTFDESHTRILRMFGLTGYAIFVWIFIWFFKKLLFIYRNAKDAFSKEFGITFLAFFPSMVILTFTRVYLVAYDVIFVFATIFALATVTASRLSDSDVAKVM
jgi:hypothetical protein